MDQCLQDRFLYDVFARRAASCKPPNNSTQIWKMFRNAIRKFVCSLIRCSLFTMINLLLPTAACAIALASLESTKAKRQLASPAPLLLVPCSTYRRSCSSRTRPVPAGFVSPLVSVNNRHVCRHSVTDEANAE